MIGTLIGLFETSQYEDKQVITAKNLVETTWITWHSLQNEIVYYQGWAFIGHEFKNIFFHE